MKFTPFKGSIEVEPMQHTEGLQTEDPRFLSLGKVLSLGEGTEDFFKVGDIVAFESVGSSLIKGFGDEKDRYIVRVNERVINGKFTNE